jgi:hypothetical protein
MFDATNKKMKENMEIIAGRLSSTESDIKIMFTNKKNIGKGVRMMKRCSSMGRPPMNKVKLLNEVKEEKRATILFMKPEEALREILVEPRV